MIKTPTLLATLLLTLLVTVPANAHTEADPGVDTFAITGVISEAVSHRVERGELRLDREMLVATVGCNAVSMDASVRSGGRIIHGLIRSTEMACIGAAAEAELALLRVLAGADLRLEANSIESDAGSIVLDPQSLCRECSWRDEAGVLHEDAPDGSSLLLVIPLVAGLAALALAFGSRSSGPRGARRSLTRRGKAR